VYAVSLGKFKQKGYLGALSVLWRKVSIWVIKKQVVSKWTGFRWLRIGKGLVSTVMDLHVA
jgi:hypothetical protein